MPDGGQQPGRPARPATAGTAPAGTITGPAMRVFPGEAGQIREVRAFVAGTLGRSPAAEEAVLLASELAANAVVHTASGDGGTFTVLLREDGGTVMVEVHDDGSETSPEAAPAGAPGESGRGLCLVDALAERWGHRGGREGRVVWFEVKQR